MMEFLQFLIIEGEFPALLLVTMEMLTLEFECAGLSCEVSVSLFTLLAQQGRLGVLLVRYGVYAVDQVFCGKLDNHIPYSFCFF